MPQGLRSCGCPARWCSCGGTINKSELRTKTKAAIVRKVTIPPDIDVNVPKIAPIPEDLKKNKSIGKKNNSIGKPASKLQNTKEAFLQGSEENAKPVKEAVLKRGRSKALGLENAKKALQKVETEASPEEVENAPVKESEHELHKYKKAKVEGCAPNILEPSVESRAKESRKNGVVQVQVKLHAEVLEKNARRVSAGKLRSRIKSQITLIRREEALLEAYGGSGEKLRPEKELLRARGQIHRSKLAIRGAVHELEVIMRHGCVQEQKENGHLDHEQIACAVCQSGQVTPSNDILLCDGGCDRAFHQYCLDPAVTSEQIPGVEESWFCPACDVKLDCIHAINKQFGTELLMSSTWKDVFPMEAEQKAAGTSPAAAQEAEWPSDDSADEDFDPDAEVYSEAEGKKDGELGGTLESTHGEDEAARRDSDESDDDMDDDVSDGEAKALLEEAGADAAGGLSNEVEERPEDLIIEGKRRRTPVDYRILNFALFGFDDITDDLDDDAGLPRKKRRSKNGLEEPLFTTDVTGAPRSKPDVSTPLKEGPAPLVKPQVEAETVALGEAKTIALGELETMENGDQMTQTKGEEAVETETKAEIDLEAEQNGKPASAEGAVRAPDRASKYRPELEDVAYDVLKTSFLDNQMPTLEKKQELSKQLKLPFDQVNRWFRGYRHKVLTALDRPPDEEPVTARPAGSKYPLPSASEIAAEEAAERDRRLNMVLASTGKLRAALERAAELRRVARENGEESSEADSPRWTETGAKMEPSGIFAKLKQRGVGEFAVKKGKRTGYGSGEDRKNSEAHVLQNTLKRLAALDTRPLSVNGNRMGRPPIRMIELMAEVECLHGGQIPELLAKRQGLQSAKGNGRPPTLLQQSLIGGRKELARGDDDFQNLVASEGSGSWGSGRSSQLNPTAANGAAVEIVRPRIGRPPKVLKEETGLLRGGSLNSNQSFDEDESGLEDSWVAALDKRPFSKNGKRMGRPSRQVKEAILQYRKEKQAAAEASGRDGGGLVGPSESTEEPARAYGEAPPVLDGPLPRFSKSGKRIGRPPRAIRKMEAESVAMVQAVHTAEPLHRSDSLGSLDGLVTGPDGVRYSKSGRRIGKPQRLGVVDCDELLQIQEEAPAFATGPSKRMTSHIGSFDDLTAAIDHLEKPTVKVPRRERSADPLFDERAILSGIRARVASSNKLSACATSSGNDVTGRNSGGAEVQSPAPGVNRPSQGVVHRPNDPLESLFTAAAAHELKEEETNGVEVRKEAFDVEHLLMVVTNAGLANPAGLMDQPEYKAEVEMSKPAADSVEEPVKVSVNLDDVDTQQIVEQDVLDVGHEVGKSGGHLDASASGPIPFESNFGSSGNLVAIAASLLSPVRRPDRPPRKGGKRAFSSLARVGSVPGLATMGLATQSSSGAPSEGMSV